MAGLPKKEENNTRRKLIPETDFAKLLDSADSDLRPILLVAYDTGLRKTSILRLKWEHVDLSGERGRIHLTEAEIKEHSGVPVVVLTDRATTTLRGIPKSESGFVFVNPRTKKPWVDIRRMFKRALKGAGLHKSIWFHDQRRSFITNSRRRGVDETTVMSMSGHKTRSAFTRYNIADVSDQEAAVAKIEVGRTRELSAVAQ